MTGLTVSVGYAEELDRSLPQWIDGLDHCIVVTDQQDQDTADVARQHGAAVWRTGIFYRNGASFNKGGAMAAACRALGIERISGQDTGTWICIFDADIVPPPCWWFDLLDTMQPGNLYGAPRYQDGQHLIPDPDHEMPGYFWMFHTSDNHLPPASEPLFTSWRHAGNYDTVFKNRWPADKRIKLDIQLNHIGTPGRNWWGKGNDHMMSRMYVDRARQGGYHHEAV